LRRLTNLLIAGTLVASGLGGVIAASAQPAYAAVVETCKKASGSATLSPGIPTATKKDTGGMVTGTAVTASVPIFTPGADNPASKLKGVPGTGQTGAFNAGTSWTVVDSTHATLSSPATTNGPTTLKLTRNWTSTITQNPPTDTPTTVKKCSGAIGTGLSTDTAVTTLNGTVTTLVPGNCTSLAAPSNGVTQFSGSYTTTFNVGGSPVGTVSGTLTAKSNGAVAQEALTSTITSATGAASPGFVGRTTTLTITFAPTATGGNCSTANITQVSIASAIVNGVASKAITN
jgi:hypothetical protein